MLQILVERLRDPDFDEPDESGPDDAVAGVSGVDASDGGVAELDGAGLDAPARGSDGLGVPEPDGLGVAEAPDEGRFIDDVPLLPEEVLRPLALQPTSMTERKTAPNVARDTDERTDRLPWVLEVFVIMWTTLAAPNLEHFAVVSRTGLIYP